MPYQWGPNVLMYNTKVFKDGAEELERRVRGADPARRQVRTRAACRPIDGPIYIADAALYLMAHKPELGIKDPYELNEDAVQGGARRCCAQQRTLVQRYWHDATVQIDDFKNEGVVASGSWPFQVNTAAVANKQPIASDRPRGRRHRLGRHHHDARRAPHPNCAYMWMEHSLDAEGAGRRRRLVRLGAGRCPPPARATSCSADEGCKTNGIENFDKIHFWRTPVAKCATQSDGCVPY